MPRSDRTRVETAIVAARATGRGALMPFVTAGFPTMDDTAAALPAIAAAGADAIEIGIPFSDPIADGPVIAESMHAALARGATPQAIFELVGRVRPRVEAALLAMVSCSIVRRIGGDRFVAMAADGGIDGLVVPDIDLDDAPALAAACARRGLSFTLLVAPTSPARRIERIVALCSGFVYVLARLGITGEPPASSGGAARDGSGAGVRPGGAPSDGLAPRIAELRAMTDLPLAVGFGIAGADQVAAVLEHADAAIVGSALVRRMGEAVGGGVAPAAAAWAFVAELARGAAVAGARR